MYSSMPTEAGRGTGSPMTGVIDSCKPPSVGFVDAGPLGEQSVLLTAEQRSSPEFSHLCVLCVTIF